MLLSHRKPTPPLAPTTEPTAAPEPRPGPACLPEIFCYLACVGTQAFRPEALRAVLDASPESLPDGVLERLTEVSRRIATSEEVGRGIARALASKDREAASCFQGMLPALVEADLAMGFRVVPELAASASPAVAYDLMEGMLSLTMAEGQRAATATRPETASLARQRGRYLVSALSLLPLDTANRVRLFLSLSQSLQDGALVVEVIRSSLFPATPEETLAMVAEGNDRALAALIEGAILRPMGKEEFYATCRAAVGLGLNDGLPILARIYRIVCRGSARLSPLASLVRASLLLALERAASNAAEDEVLPARPDVWCIHLLTMVAPGLREATRQSLCAYLADAIEAALPGAIRDPAAADILVQATVSLSVMYRSPAEIGERIRRAILQTSGALHARLQATEKPADADLVAAATFRRMVVDLDVEFRRRDALRTCLTPVVPLVFEGFARYAATAIRPQAYAN